jgi:hypothetical protein
LIKFKSPGGVQTILLLMGKVRNIFAIDVGRYTKNAMSQRLAFNAAKPFGMKLLKGFLLPKIQEYSLSTPIIH